MAHAYQTARKSTTVMDMRQRRVDRFYDCRRRAGEDLTEFVVRYWTSWRRAHPYGVGRYDGIVQLIDNLPREWSEWTEATAKRFLRHNAPSVVLDGDMPGFVKAMFEILVDHPDLPPSAFTVEPPTIPLELPPWAFLGRDEGESSRSSRASTEDGDRYDSEEEESEDNDHESEDDEEEYHAEGDLKGHHIEDTAGEPKEDYAWDTEDEEEEDDEEYAEDVGKGKVEEEEGPHT